MEFKIIFNNPDELLEKDASLSFGYFDICSKDLKVSLFFERSCIVFLTLSSIIYFLEQNLKTFIWVGEDNGKSFQVTKRSENIEIKDKQMSININHIAFEKAVRSAANQLLTESKGANPKIADESAFLDLYMSLFPTV